MEKEFINYEQALALNKLGFDKNCCAYYGAKNKKLYECNFRDNVSNDIVSAPLFQQAFRWLREKYELFASINHDHRDRTDPTPYFYMIDDCPSLDYKVYRTQEDFDIQKTLFYNSYEEAELECLKKLIEICQQTT